MFTAVYCIVCTTGLPLWPVGARGGPGGEATQQVEHSYSEIFCQDLDRSRSGTGRSHRNRICTHLEQAFQLISPWQACSKWHSNFDKLNLEYLVSIHQLAMPAQNTKCRTYYNLLAIASVLYDCYTEIHVPTMNWIEIIILYLIGEGVLTVKSSVYYDYRMIDNQRKRRIMG